MMPWLAKLCCWDAGAVKVAVAPPAEACAGEDALVKVEDVEDVEKEEMEGESGGREEKGGREAAGDGIDGRKAVRRRRRERLVCWARAIG